MRIAVLSPVWFAVPPTGYGGIEWVVSLLSDGLADAGHDATLFASGDSRTHAQLASVYAEAPSAQIGRTEPELRHALACYERADEFDVINDHTGMLGAVLGGAVSTPVVHTVHGPLDGQPGAVYESIARVSPQVGLISISMNQRKPKPHLPWIANCPNALDFSFYPCKPHRGDYLFFLGRMSPDKGAHRAIAVAMELGLPLKLAGKKQDPKEIQYFDELVAPHLVDGIEYLGEVTHGEKVELLQHGYRIQKLQQDQAAEVEINRRLRLEVETLRAPERIEEIAKKLNLVAPPRDRAIVIERVTPSASPGKSVVAAR